MNILILCTGNSCRSQMAEGFLKAFDDNMEIYSAGTKPSGQVHPKAVQVMGEIGVDIKNNHPQSVDDFVDKSFDFVITVCGDAKETCPIFAGKVDQKLHIGFDDPADAIGTEEEILSEFIRIRNKILIDFFRFYNTKIVNK